jgi:hypothetical protein
VATIKVGHLVAGNWLIINNTSIHFSSKTWELLTSSTQHQLHLPSNHACTIELTGFASIPYSHVHFVLFQHFGNCGMKEAFFFYTKNVCTL